MKEKRLERGIIIAVVLLLLASLLACQLGRKQATPEVMIVTPTPMAAVLALTPTSLTFEAMLLSVRVTSGKFFHALLKESTMVMHVGITCSALCTMASVMLS